MPDQVPGRAYPRAIPFLGRLSRRALLVLGAAALVAGCIPAPWPGVGDIRCPVTGTVSFRDDFGEPRGDHTHQGIDIFAPRNRANVAVVDGRLQQKFDSTGGGNTIWLTDGNGTRFVYLHLERFEGGPRTVRAGDVIGYTGDSGNARGTHTHFEIRPNGGAAVNPFGNLIEACPHRA